MIIGTDLLIIISSTFIVLATIFVVASLRGHYSYSKENKREKAFVTFDDLDDAVSIYNGAGFSSTLYLGEFLYNFFNLTDKDNTLLTMNNNQSAKIYFMEAYVL